MSSLVPIVIGVGDVVNRSLKLEDAKEPADLILDSIHKALSDTGLSEDARSRLQSSIDSIAVVRTWTWPYPDLPGLLSSKLGIEPSHKEYTDHGGNTPGRIFDEAARRISQKECKVAVITGGEALASLNAFAKARKLPPPGWTALDTKVDSVFSPTGRELSPSNTSTNAMVGQAWAADNTGGLGGIHGIGAPIHIYPLYENGYRQHYGQTIAENNEESAKLYTQFAEVAKQNEYAWNYGRAETQQSIGTVSEKNRMICFPYPLLMNAFNTVNLAAACILTSTAYAEELGIPKSKWIYPLGGAGTRDSYDFWERPNYYSAPCISESLDAALKVSNLTKDDIDLYDFYSCFPIVPKLAARHLSLSPSTPLTLLGGLTSFGGAGNNYSMHALTAMTRALRRRPKSSGLVLANGGVATYQYVVTLSTHPRASNSPYPSANPLPDALPSSAYETPMPEIASVADGSATIETYTVEYDRANRPKTGFVVGRLREGGARFVANHGDEATLRVLAGREGEPIGRSGWVRADPKRKGRNLFVVGEGARL